MTDKEERILKEHLRLSKKRKDIRAILNAGGISEEIHTLYILKMQDITKRLRALEEEVL